MRVKNMGFDYLKKNILITAGPTVEDIDPVRFISNRSSGKMGIALVNEALNLGANVTLIHGPLQIQIPNHNNLKTIYTRSAEKMLEAVLDHIKEQDIAIFAAAVCDYRPKVISQQKLKKSDSDVCPFENISWVKNPDILATISALPQKPFLVGFAAESENIIENGTKKLGQKKCDMICVNDISSSEKGFEVDYNQVTIISKKGQTTLPILSKAETAKEIFHLIKNIL